ncbi:hypothetical protein D3C72_1942170 [compost metagenome]
MIDDDCPGRDQTFVSNMSPLDNRGARSDVDPITDLYSSRERYPGSQVDVISDGTVMINQGACVDEDVYTNSASRLNDCPCHHLRALEKLGLGRNNR